MRRGAAGAGARFRATCPAAEAERHRVTPRCDREKHAECHASAKTDGRPRRACPRPCSVNRFYVGCAGSTEFFIFIRFDPDKSILI